MHASTIQTADTARRHGAIGLGALDMQLLVETRLVLGAPEEGEIAHALILTMREHAGEEPVGMILARFLARGLGVCSVKDVLAILKQLLAPLDSCHRGVKSGKTIAQGAEVFLERVDLDALGEPVNAHHIELEVCSQHSAIIGQ